MPKGSVYKEHVIFPETTPPEDADAKILAELRKDSEQVFAIKNKSK